MHTLKFTHVPLLVAARLFSVLQPFDNEGGGDGVAENLRAKDSA